MQEAVIEARADDLHRMEPNIIVSSFKVHLHPYNVCTTIQ